MAYLVHIHTVKLFFIFLKLQLFLQPINLLFELLTVVFFFDELLVERVPVELVSLLEGFQLGPALLINLEKLLLITLELPLMNLVLFEVQIYLSM